MELMPMKIMMEKVACAHNVGFEVFMANECIKISWFKVDLNANVLETYSISIIRVYIYINPDNGNAEGLRNVGY
jgi:hypothetical protein